MVVLRYNLDLFVKDFPQFDRLVCEGNVSVRQVLLDTKINSKRHRLTICAQEEMSGILPFNPFDPVDLFLNL